MSGCQKTTNDLPVKDQLNFYDSSVSFSAVSIYTSGSISSFRTTISAPSSIQITGYGHCWKTQVGNPSISDQKTAFGPISSNNFTISSTIPNYYSWNTYYVRAYVQTANGIIYGITYKSN